MPVSMIGTLRRLNHTVFRAMTSKYLSNHLFIICPLTHFTGMVIYSLTFSAVMNCESHYSRVSVWNTGILVGSTQLGDEDAKSSRYGPLFGIY